MKWKTQVPSGSSSPIVVGDLLVLTAFDGGKLYTIAYNRADGKESWRAEAPAKAIEAFHITEGSPAASSPVTDGERIVSYFGSCGLFCYDLAGKELWKYELPTAATPFDFGTGVSPVLADGLVVLQRDENKNPRILAVDAVTGKLAWEKPRESKSAFCSPVVCDTPGGKEVVAVGVGRMIGYDLKGWRREMDRDRHAVVHAQPGGRWRHALLRGLVPRRRCQASNIRRADQRCGREKQQGFITPEGLQRVFFKGMLDDRDFDHRTARGVEDLPGRLKGMFTSHDWDHDGKLTREEWDDAVKLLSTSKNSAFALKLGGSGDVTDSHVLWKQKSGLPYVPSGIVYRGQYVLVKDGGVIWWLKKSGKQTVSKARPPTGRAYASPVAANGYIYAASTTASSR